MDIGVRDHFRLGGGGVPTTFFCPNFSFLPEKSNMFGQCIFASHGGGGGKREQLFFWSD